MGLTFEPGRHRYTLDTPQGVQAKVSGVTTLIGGGIPKPAIAPWHGRMVAEWVDANPQEVERLRGLPDVRSRGRTRTALVDHKDPALKRLVYRLWLSMPNSRALPEDFAELWGPTEAGEWT